jgi:hypothetical protein
MIVPSQKGEVSIGPLKFHTQKRCGLIGPLKFGTEKDTG